MNFLPLQINGNSEVKSWPFSLTTTLKFPSPSTGVPHCTKLSLIKTPNLGTPFQLHLKELNWTNPDPLIRIELLPSQSPFVGINSVIFGCA